MLFFGLMIVFVLDYTRPDQFFPFILPLKLYALVPMTVLLFALMANTRNSNAEIFGSGTGRLLLWLLMLAAVSMFFALDFDRAWVTWQALLGYMLLFFMVAKLCDSKSRLKWLFRCIVGIHVWLVFQNPALLTNPNQRSYIENVTFLGDGNDFSLSAAITLPMCLYLFQSSRGSVEKVLYVFAAIVVFGAIMGTQSRGAGLGVIAVVFFLWTLSKSKGKATVFVVAGLFIVLAVASEAYLTRMQTIATYTEDGSANARLAAWGAGIDMANRRPLTGVGPGCFPIAFGNWGYSRPGMPMMNAHSLYFLALGDLGYSGIALLLWLLWTMFRDNQAILKSMKRDLDPEQLDHRQLIVAVTASLIAFVVAGAFLSVLYYPHLYVIAGIIFAAKRIYQLDYPRESGVSENTAPEKPSTRLRVSARGRSVR